MLKILSFFFLFVISACANKPDTDNPEQNVSIQWQYFTLEFNDTVIHLIQSTDTLELTMFKEGVQKYPINKAERDSLFIQANELIYFKKQPNHFCTDYVGKLKIRIRYNPQLLKEVIFSSICNWRELDTTTKRIDQLLKKVVGNK